jgi:hypothetical protein
MKIRQFLIRFSFFSLIVLFGLLLPKSALAMESGRVDSIADGFFTGAVANDQLGSSLAKAGDINGDGYDDFLIGAPLFDTPSADAGAVYLILGRAEPWSLSTPIAQVPTIRYSGEAAGDQA